MIGPELGWVMLAAVGAGLIDAIAGGGGLIMIPALFTVYPEAPPASLLGTSKASSVWGTALAAMRYRQRAPLTWRVLGPACVTAWLGALSGAWWVAQIDAERLRWALPGMLLAVLVYTLWHKDLGAEHQPRWHGPTQTAMCCAIGAVMGIYDGFFGPGTGTLLIFLLIRGLGFDFLNAAAAAKTLNTVTNLSALAWFASQGHVWWPVALAMTAAHLIGTLIGTRIAFRVGSVWLRRVFVGVVTTLVFTTFWERVHASFF